MSASPADPAAVTPPPDPAARPDAPGQIDPRGPRFAAGVTSVVLVATVLTGSRWLLAAQVAVFAVGAVAGVQASPYGLVFRYLIRPRLGPPKGSEDPRPPQFAQVVGLLVTGLGLVLALAEVHGAVVVAGLVALVAAFLNAAFGLCLGCELYLLLARLTPGFARAREGAVGHASGGIGQGRVGGPAAPSTIQPEQDQP